MQSRHVLSRHDRQDISAASNWARLFHAPCYNAGHVTTQNDSPQPRAWHENHICNCCTHRRHLPDYLYRYSVVGNQGIWAQLGGSSFPSTSPCEHSESFHGQSPERQQSVARRSKALRPCHEKPCSVIQIRRFRGLRNKAPRRQVSFVPILAGRAGVTDAWKRCPKGGLGERSNFETGRINAPRAGVHQLSKTARPVLENRAFRELLDRHPRLRRCGPTITRPARPVVTNCSVCSLCKVLLHAVC